MILSLGNGITKLSESSTHYVCAGSGKEGEKVQKHL
jgi:hypothetical protein